VTGLSYIEYRTALVELFAVVDPVGLVESGAPSDEYEREIDELVRWRTPVTADQVKETFLRWFGEPTGRIADDDAARLADGIADLRARLRAG
jgi:hypothetical protein